MGKIDIQEGNIINVINNRDNDKFQNAIKGNIVRMRYDDEHSGYDIMLDTGYVIFIESPKNKIGGK
jgi:hypothetical protein